MTRVLHAPLDGAVIGLADVPDPVFAEAIVGPGFALLLPEDSESVDACAPISGRLSSLHPHAFIVSAPELAPVLVHLGIETVGLHGEGFTSFAEVGEALTVGDTVISWDLCPARREAMALVVPVIVLDPNGRVELLVDTGADVRTGDPIARILE